MHKGQGDTRTARPSDFMRLRDFTIYSPENLQHGRDVTAQSATVQGSGEGLRIGFAACLRTGLCRQVCESSV